MSSTTTTKRLGPSNARPENYDARIISGPDVVFGTGCWVGRSDDNTDLNYYTGKQIYAALCGAACLLPRKGR